MPELPEVETIARQLQAVLPGRIFKKITVLRSKSAASDLSSLVGARIVTVFRRGKMVVHEVVGPDYRQPSYLVVHLKMTGQLIFQQPSLSTNPTQHFDNPQGRIVGGHPSVDWVGDLPSKHTRIVIEFTDDTTLFFNDLRVFGWMKRLSEHAYHQLDHSLPPDAIDPEFTETYLKTILSRSRRPVKLVIMDATLLGGVGNIYANDALFMAGIDPRRAANSITLREVERLHEAIQTVIAKGIALGGASEKDYVHVDGHGGHYQDHFLVYKQQGKVCPTGCGAFLIKIQLGGRGTYYCPACQR